MLHSVLSCACVGGGQPLLAVAGEVELGGLPVLALPQRVELAVVHQLAARRRRSRPRAAPAPPAGAPRGRARARRGPGRGRSSGRAARSGQMSPSTSMIRSCIASVGRELARGQPLVALAGHASGAGHAPRRGLAGDLQALAVVHGDVPVALAGHLVVHGEAVPAGPLGVHHPGQRAVAAGRARGGRPPATTSPMSSGPLLIWRSFSALQPAAADPDLARGGQLQRAGAAGGQLHQLARAAAQPEVDRAVLAAAPRARARRTPTPARCPCPPRPAGRPACRRSARRRPAAP